MKTISISTAKSSLNELVDDAATTHEHVTITRNGSPAAVLVSAEEWDSLQETLHWLSQTDTIAAVSEARADLDAGRTISADVLRDRYSRR
ncbi:type II toxin-antitoxin system Phd/YefM family antitoxin [Tsukamurella sp. 1534]|uniref:type II toxin-antitoxin system Phd/YefM family antitoxin n=1 Tax=Tsukamurella sp. 1534 TaxID=1151061 RepID=UPI0003183911|nr:type II toxin-antitoxin system Phd/YefM family antitoxin [Tsukamurella sp. 1534]